jgi:hypothetical protein
LQQPQALNSARLVGLSAPRRFMPVDHVDVSTSEGVGHTVVICGHACKLGSEAERACNVDGVEGADVDPLHISRGGHDVLAQLDDGGRGDDALQDQTSVNGRLGSLRASPCHTVRCTSVWLVCSCRSSCSRSRSALIGPTRGLGVPAIAASPVSMRRQRRVPPASVSLARRPGRSTQSTFMLSCMRQIRGTDSQRLKHQSIQRASEVR